MRADVGEEGAFGVGDAVAGTDDPGDRRSGLHAEVVRRAGPSGVEIGAGRHDERELADRRARTIRLALSRTERGVAAVAQLAGFADAVAAEGRAGAIGLTAARA